MLIMPIASHLLGSLESALGSDQPAPAPTASQIRADYEALGGALNSGNLSSAQKAFAQLEVDSPKVAEIANAPVTGAGNNIQTLSTALQAGNLSGAQSAFAAMQQAESTIPWHNHHVLGVLANQTSTTSALQAAGSSAAGSLINLNI